MPHPQIVRERATCSARRDHQEVNPDRKDAAAQAVAKAWRAGCPVAGGGRPDRFDEIAEVAVRRWASAGRRWPEGLTEETRVEDLAKGLIARFAEDPKLVGPLIEDYRYLARLIADAFAESD